MSKADRVSLAGTVVAIALGVALAAAGSVGSVEVGGVPLFGLVVTLAFLINAAAFVPAFKAQTERFYDLTGSVTYATSVIVALVAGGPVDARAAVVGALVLVWAGRLGTFLFRRVVRDGQDGRFDRIKTNGPRFFMTWVLQGLWVSTTLAAGLAAMTTEDPVDLDGWAAAGVTIWIVGFVIEVVADDQKRRFRLQPENEGRFITTGLWSWSRHPNYFGEIALWVGIAAMAVPTLSGWRWLTLISPVFVFVLITRISGVPMLERRAEKRWGDDPDYRRYVESTPVLLLRPPRS